SVQPLERSWWQLFWQWRHRCRPVEDMAGGMGATAVGVVGTASTMPRPVMLRADTSPFVFAMGVAANLSGLRAVARVMRSADITELAAIAGEAGEVTTDIRIMDIPAIV